MMDTFVLIAVPLATAVLGFAFWLAVLSKKSSERDSEGRKSASEDQDGDSK